MSDNKDVFLSENEINFKQGEDLAFFAFSKKNISINVQNGFNHQNAGIELSEDHTNQLIEFINKPLKKQNAELNEFIKQLYNTECTTSAFDYQCIIRSKINKFKHRG